MADRYWVGGTGTWDLTSTTNWSATSGGAGGASVPTVADNIFFDQAGTYTVTVSGGARSCLDITVSAGVVTFSGSGFQNLTVAGSLSFLSTTTWNAQTVFSFTATTTGKTVTASGAFPISAFSFDGVGGGWTLGSAVSFPSGSLSVAAGSFNSANYSITCVNFIVQGSLVRSVTLGSSTVTVTSGNANAIAAANITNLTFNAGTSQFNLTGTSSGIASGGALTFYNVAFTGTGAGTKTITGTNTFNNLSVTGPASAGVVTVTFAAQQTINGTLSTTGTAGNRRVFFTTATYGISHDLVVNSAPSLTDADFRGLYVRGTAAPISGTRIGNRGECRGITFDAPKTVYWNRAAGGNWSTDSWALSSGGGVSTDNFPLAQDTATIANTGLNTSATITLDGAVAYVGNIDMSGRTNAMTLSNGISSYTVYGNWTNGSGVTLSTPAGLVFSGGTTQTITSAGKTFPSIITVDTYGGTVQLADAFNCGSQSFNLSNGTFDTQGYSISTGSFNSQIDAVRALNFRNSTVSVQAFNAANTQKLNFNSGTSTLEIRSNVGALNISATGELTFYNVSWTSPGAQSVTITALSFTCNNLFFTAPSLVGIGQISFATTNATINGTLTCAGASAVQRILLRSNTIGTPRTLTVNSISATDCDFRDITLAGTASGASPTRAGDCGGNTGITFPAAKTVYWNLAGAQNWSATGWAPSSGGSPAVNEFPLAQDTAVFDEAGSVTGTITINAAWNIGTFDASLRTSAMTLTTGSNAPVVYGDWLFGTGVTSSSSTGAITFAKNGTQTITSNGVQFNYPIRIDHPLANVQLADALSLGSTRTLTLSAGTFDAVTYNVTIGLFTVSGTSILRMGSGTWTVSGVDTVWNASGTSSIIAGISTLVFSDTSTTARSFIGGNFYYNKLTIGGATGTSTFSIQGANTFGELASTKTVAHTISFVTNQTYTVGKWSVTGTSGNVVTVNSSAAGTTFTLSIAGPANSGIDYLSVRDCLVLSTSPGEFYVGANSTNVSGNTSVIFTATPAPRTLYWVGGTGAWSATSDWSLSSGGAGGEPIPTSLDSVIFDSASNATAYTVTVSGVTLARCAAFTMAGPASGNVTFAGSVGIAFHGDVSFAATGITRTYTGTMNWAGNSSYTFTTNGLALASTCFVIGVGSTWVLGSALNIGTAQLNTTYGTFSTSVSNYSLTSSNIFSSNNNIRSINFNGSTITCGGTGSNSLSFANITNFTFTAGASQINLTATNAGISCTGLSFYNVSFTSASNTSITITGANTFNTLSFASRTNLGITSVTFNADQTIGTLTLNAGTAAAYRTFLASNTIGTQRTLNVTTLTAGAADIDFRAIAITGAAAPLTGTRFGDAKGNSGITFDAAKTVYYRQTGNNNWGATGTGSWSATSGGSADATQFPLAQDTAVFPAATYPSSGSTTTVNAAYNIGTIDMSLRTTNTMTLAVGTNTPAIYGNWINGTGTTLTGTGQMTFAGRSAQTITSAGKTFTQRFGINTPSGSVTLQDAFTCSNTTSNVLELFTGTLDANGYAATFTATSAVSQFGTVFGGTLPKTVAIGSGTWTLAGSGSPWNISGSNLTVTGTGAISLTSAATKTFAGGGVNYSGITLNQGGAGTLTITGNNTFKDITNTYSATGATTINLGATTQTLTSPWTATGEATRVLNVTGTSAASPATLRFTGTGAAADVDYLAINNVRAYDIFDEWYAGPNSTNGGSLGWYFIAKPTSNIYAVYISESASGVDAVLATATASYDSSVSESASGADAVAALSAFNSSVIETASGADAVSALAALSSAIAESASGADVTSALASLASAVAEAASGGDSQASTVTLLSNIAEAASAIDAVASGAVFTPIILESASGADATNSALTAGALVQESTTASDATNSVLTAVAFVSESNTALDSVSTIMVAESSVSESAVAADTAASSIIVVSAVDEATEALDASAAQMTASSSVSEAGRASEIVATQFTAAASINEASIAADSLSSAMTAESSVSESANVADAASSAFTVGSAINETAQVADASAAQMTAQSSVAEAAQAADQAAAQQVALAQIADTAQALDAQSAQLNAAASVAESVQAADQTASGYVAQSQVSETAQALDQTSSSYVALSDVSETAGVQDTANAAFVAGSAVSESAQAQDTTAAVPTYLSSTSEAARPSDAVATSAVFFAQVLAGEGGTGTVTENTSTYPLGTSFTGSQFFNSSSAGNGVSVVANGTGTGTAGGFNAGGNYIRFGGTGTTGTRPLTTVPLNLASATSVTISAISGNNTNGGEVPDSGESLGLYYSLNGVAYTLVDLLMAPGNPSYPLSPTFSNFVEVLPPAAKTSSTYLQIRQASNSGPTFDTYGVRQITITYPGGGGSVGVSDSAQAGGTYNAPIADTVRVQDTAVARMTAGSAVAESASAQDEVTPDLQIFRSVQELAEGSDQIQAGAVFRGTAQEFASVQDAAASQLVIVSNANESARGQDQESAQVSFGAQVQEEAAAQDSVARQLIVPRTVSETASAQDSVARQLIVPRSVSETASAQDQEAASLFIVAQVQEDTAAQDSIAGQLIIPRTVNESAQAAEQVQTKAVFRGAAQETARVADALIVGGDFTAATSESAQISDQAAAGLTAESSVSEQASMADAVVGIRVTFGIVAESAQASDQDSATLIAGARIAEQADARDSVASTAVFISSIAELGRALDTAVGFIVVPASVAELAEAQDSAVGFITFPTVISEGATGTELTAVQATFRGLIAEQAAGQDVVDAPGSTYNVQIAQSIRVEDSLFVNGTYNAAIGETLVVLDQAAAAYLWNLIDDTQTPDWGAIANAQTPDWVEIPNEQSSGWQNIPNTQAPGWSDVDDNQAPNWQNIDTV